MTSLREAAQQALSVLTMFNAEDSVFKGEFDQEITALRTALAEPDQDDTALLRQALEALEYEAQRGNDDAYRSLRDAIKERLGEKT
jgi:hypothetical protein